METYTKAREGYDQQGREFGVYHASDTSTVLDAIAANGYKLAHCEDHIDGSDNGAKFVGRRFLSGKHAVAAAAEVWKAGLDEIESMIAELSTDLPAPVSRRRKPKWLADDGSDICLDRLRAGQEYWREARRQVSHGVNTITIITNMATSAAVKSNKILWRGAAAVAVTHLLEEAGYRVELIAASCVQNNLSAAKNGGPGHTIHAITLKQPEQPVDLATLTNWVSGWAYRTVWWMWKNCHGVPTCTYGQPAEPDQPGFKNALTTDRCAYVVTGVWDRHAAIRSAKSILDSVRHASGVAA